MRFMPQSTSTYFNPRTREGCDGTNAILNFLTQISIHAPARGATYQTLNI